METIEFTVQALTAPPQGLLLAVFIASFIAVAAVCFWVMVGAGVPFARVAILSLICFITLGFAELFAFTLIATHAEMESQETIARIAEESHGVMSLETEEAPVNCFEGQESRQAHYTWTTEDGSRVEGTLSRSSAQDGECDITLKPRTVTLPSDN